VTFVLNASGSSPLNIVTDINLLDDKPIDTQIRSPVPHNIGLRMQYQEAGQMVMILHRVQVLAGS
jgi:hypothetical protein